LREQFAQTGRKLAIIGLLNFGLIGAAKRKDYAAPIAWFRKENWRENNAVGIMGFLK
jgi:hypothetical protein